MNLNNKTYNTVSYLVNSSVHNSVHNSVNNKLKSYEFK
jgi:hypothetical protein